MRTTQRNDYMTRKRKDLEVGIFAESANNLEEFASNIYMAQYFQEVVEGHIKLEKEYHEALLSKNEDVIAEKIAEMEIYDNSIALTYHLFDGTEILQ